MFSKTTKLNAVVVIICGLLQLPAMVLCGAYGLGGPLQLTTATGYVSTYDHMDVNRLLKNDKLVSAYVRCFLNEGPCTMEGKQVKSIIYII